MQLREFIERTSTQPLADYLRPYILLPGIVGEGSLTLWLLVKGVNVQRWKEQANAAGMRRT
jgi:hypothetical protein